jgi:hypothetical protein
MDDDQARDDRARDLAFVTTALGSAGIRPSDDELAALARRVPTLRRQVARFYAVDAGDAAPIGRLRAGE